MNDYSIDAKRSKYKKQNGNYYTDSIFEIIDVEEELNKINNIPRIDEKDFIYPKEFNNDINIYTKEKLINNSHKINVFKVFKELSENINFKQFFEIINFMGEGAFGIVISAIDKIHQQKVAIKIIPKFKFKGNVHEYLNREVNIQSGVSHKHIIKLYSVHETKDYLCLVMELCEGGSLKDLIIRRYYSNNQDFMQEEEIISIIKRILKGLDYMYSINIMHRDIKPGITIYHHRKYHVQQEK